MGVRSCTLGPWERGTVMPFDRLYPKIIRYLGREPWATPKTLGELLKAERLRRGLAPRVAAKLIGISDGTLQRLEEKDELTYAPARARIERFLATASPLNEGGGTVSV